MYKVGSILKLKNSSIGSGTRWMVTHASGNEFKIGICGYATDKKFKELKNIHVSESWRYEKATHLELDPRHNVVSFEF